MTSPRVTGQFYEREFEDFEKNRIYPPWYRKENRMKRLTIKHAESVSAAKMLLQYKMSNDQPARYRAILEGHDERLSDVYWWIVHSVVNPGLPLDQIPNSNDKPNPKEPADDGTAARHD